MSWRDDPGLVRGGTPAQPGGGRQLDPRWDKLLATLHQLARGMGVPDMVVKLGLARGRSAALQDPEGSRSTLIGLIQLMAATLEINPREIYGAPEPPTAVSDQAPPEAPPGG